MPVAGLVDLLHPGAQPGDGFLPFGGRELPPRWRRAGTVAVRVCVGGSGLGELGQGVRVLAQRVADAGDQLGELGELLVVVGELLQRGGDRVVGSWSAPGVGGAVAGEPFGGHVVGDVGVRLLEDRVCAGLGGFRRELAEAAGAAVGRVLPGARQPGDDGGAAAADDQGEPGGQLADHVRGGDVVAGGVVLAADLPRRLAAQLAIQRM